MKRFAIMLGSCLLIASSVFSQHGYPKLLILEGDSVIAITPQQVRDLNVFKVTCDECKELTLGLSALQQLQEGQLQAKDNIISNQSEQLNIQQVRVDLAATAIKDMGKIIATQDRRKKWLKLQRTGLLGVVTGLIVYILISK